MYKSVVKRLIDIVLAAYGLIVLSPIFLMLAIAIVVDDSGDVFFSQERVGKNREGEVSYFKLYNIRAAVLT